MMSDETKCILWGGYGGGNVGDELTLAVALHDAARRYGERHVAVLTRSPAYTSFLFPSFRALEYKPRPVAPRWFQQIPLAALRLMGREPAFVHYRPDVQIAVPGEGAPLWVKALQHAEELYLAGGGYLSDHFNVEYLMLPVHLANRYGVRIDTAPLGLGPLWRSGSRAAISRELAAARLLVRDKWSLAACRELGLTADLRADDGFRCREVVDIVRERGSRRLTIGINVSIQVGAQRDFEEWWIEMTRIVSRWPETGCRGFSFHLHPLFDHLATSRVLRQSGLSDGHVSPPALDFRCSCRAIGALDAVVTSRFHAAVIAALLGLPGLAIANGDYYGPKMKAATEGAPRMAVVDPARTSPAEAAGMLRSVLAGGGRN